MNDATGNYEMFFRGYDPALGRMTGVDVMADQFSSLTPYNYAFNDPVFWNDPSGASPAYESATGGRSWRDASRKPEDYGGEARGANMYGSSFGPSDFNAMWNSPFGGTWNSSGGTHLFSSDAEAFAHGAGYNDYHGSWAYTRFGGSLDQRTLYGAWVNGGHQFIEIDRSGNFYVPYTNRRIDKSQYLASFQHSIAESLLDALSTTGKVMLESLQTSLDIVGLVPGAGEIADAVNAGIYALRGDYANASLSVGGMIPFAGWGATGAKLGNKAYDVYQAVDRTTRQVKYVGITSRGVTTRAGEHVAKGGVWEDLDYVPVLGATGLSKIDARIVEQNLINKFGGTNGGQLLNQINSIAPSKWGLHGIKN